MSAPCRNSIRNSCQLNASRPRAPRAAAVGPTGRSGGASTPHSPTQVVIGSRSPDSATLGNANVALAVIADCDGVTGVVTERPSSHTPAACAARRLPPRKRAGGGRSQAAGVATHWPEHARESLIDELGGRATGGRHRPQTGPAHRGSSSRHPAHMDTVSTPVRAGASTKPCLSSWEQGRYGPADSARPLNDRRTRSRRHAVAAHPPRRPHRRRPLRR